MAMRIALVYDCLDPHTVGGAERWLRQLALALAEDHEVTYVTRRQWERGEDPGLEGVECVTVSPPGPLYLPDGKRRLLPAILFGVGVFVHFVRRRRSYDVVHCLSYPYLSLIAARLALVGRGRRTRLYCEWLECLTDDYWLAYGRWSGRLGMAVQRLCVRLTPRAIAFSQHTRRRLLESGFHGEVEVVGGLALQDRGRAGTPELNGAGPLVLFAGRHVRDKGVRTLLEALAIARRSNPALRAVIAGDGPQRAAVLSDIRRLRLERAVAAPGFVPREELDRLVEQATCLAYPSVRDGYGMLVAEAAAAGLPAVVCRAPDNATVELVQEGVNGAVAEDPSPERLAAAILRVVEGGAELHRSTASWYVENAERLSMRRSIERVREIYASLDGASSSTPERSDHARPGEERDARGQIAGGPERPLVAGAPGAQAGEAAPAGFAQPHADGRPGVELGVGERLGE